MSKPTIYIAAGHGGNDPGAVSGKYIEKALTLKTALACQNYLRNYECETVMARTTDKSCTVAYKMEEVEQKQPSLVLEIHYNAGGGEGCEVYYWHTHAPSKSLAQKVLAEMVKLGQKSRGIKESKAGTSYNFGMCRQAATTGIPSILGEYAFVDNAKDQAKINSDAKLRAVGEAYAKAAIVYLGLKKKAEPPKPSPGGGSGVITVGSTVKVSGAKYATGQTIPGWVKSTTHKVSEISGDRALLGRDGGICSWVYLKDLTLVSGGVAKPIEVGCQVTINKGAVYGGLTSARGSKVPAAQLAPKKHTVSKIQANKGVQEALLKEITSWVAVSSLTRV